MGAVETHTSTVIQHDLKTSDYVHLHNHTHHSLLDGLTKMNDLVGIVKEMGMEAVAVTDHGTMSGTIEFYKAAKSAGVKPIIGMEAYVAARGRADLGHQPIRGPCRSLRHAHNSGSRPDPPCDNEWLKKPQVRS